MWVTHKHTHMWTISVGNGVLHSLKESFIYWEIHVSSSLIFLHTRTHTHTYRYALTKLLANSPSSVHDEKRDNNLLSNSNHILPSHSHTYTHSHKGIYVVHAFTALLEMTVGNRHKGIQKKRSTSVHYS